MKIGILIGWASLLLLIAGPVAAQGPTGDGYGGQGGVAGSLLQSPPGTEGSSGSAADSGALPTAQPSATGASDGDLPFTGVDLLLVGVGGLSLLGIGIGVRRLSHPSARV